MSRWGLSNSVVVGTAITSGGQTATRPRGDTTSPPGDRTAGSAAGLQRLRTDVGDDVNNDENEMMPTGQFTVGGAYCGPIVIEEHVEMELNPRSTRPT